MDERPTCQAIEQRLKELETEVEGLKMAREESAAREKRLLYILANNPAVVYTCKTVDPYACTFMSENVRAQFGYEPKEFVEDPGFWVDHIHPEDRARVFAELSSLFEYGYHSHEYRFQRNDGAFCPVRDELRLMRDAEGNPLEIVGYWTDISERTKAEEALRASEETYRTLVETSHDMIFTVDLEGRFLFTNRAFEENLGYSSDEIKRMNSFAPVHPEDLEGAKKRFAELSQGKTQNNIEYRYRTKSGSYIDILNNAAPIFDSRGNVVAALGIAKDITELKRSQKALREAHDNLELQVKERTADLARTNEELRIEIAERRRVKEALRIRDWAVESSINAMALSDLEGKLTDVNRAFLDLWGFGDAEEVLGKSAREFWVMPDKAADVIRALQDVGHWTGELRAKRSNGSFLDVQVSANMVRDEAGRPVNMMAFFVDITERKRAQEDLLAAQARLQYLLASNPAVIYSCEASEPYANTFVSDNVKMLLGYEAREFSENPNLWVDHLHPEDRPRVLTDCVRLFQEGRHRHEYRFQHKDGSYRWLRDELTLVRDAQGKPLEIVGCMSDITRERQMEEELVKAQKIESLGILAGGIAHDFNNFLTGILGNIALARMHQELESEVLDILSAAERASWRAQQLTNQLLTFSRGGAPIRKTVLISSLLRDTAGFALRGSNVKQELFIAGDLWPAEVDEGQIGQVINNLLINAVQAMPGGGTVRVSAKNVVIEEGYDLPVAPGKYIQITVQDQGVGIPKEHLEKIFDPYFSTKERGSGLGLAVSYAVIKKHAGHIRVESEPGIGTTFYVYLPASTEHVAESKDEGTEKATRRGRILVMDDQEIVRDMAERALKHIGYEVELALSGAEAIELYEKAQEGGRPFDAVILDLTVPGGMGGKDTVRRLLEIDPGVRAIVCSGYSSDPVMAEFQKYGFHGVISKPYRIEDLTEVLDRLLAKEI